MSDKLETLILFQEWRRGLRDESMDELGLNPTVIGEALDWAIAQLIKMETDYYETRR
jgi:hypothetical protein